MRLLKLSVLFLAKSLGGFWLAQRLTARQLRILCYHGIWIGDRPRMGDKLFMEPETFRQRLLLLKKGGYRVVALSQAVEELANGRLPPKTVVITIDDGWATTRSHMVPALREVGFPSTLYLTSYYVEKATPVLNILVQFLWTRATKSGLSPMDALRAVIAEAQADGHGAEIDIEAMDSMALEDGKAVFAGLLESLPTVSQRLEQVQRLAELLDVDIRAAVRGRWFDLMTPEELREAQRAGMEIQLHTHRHRFRTASPAESHQEIAENRTLIAGLLGVPETSLVHFCYPSGGYNAGQWPVLAALGIRTATTIEEGLNTSRTSRYGLRRFLDGENVTPLEFESYLSGFSELVAGLKGLLHGRRGDRPEAGSSDEWAIGSGALAKAPQPGSHTQTA